MKSFVVFHRKSGVMFKIFNKESSARRSRTVMNRNAGSDQYAYAYESVYYRDFAKTGR